MISANEYFGFVTSLVLAMGAVFELPIAILLLSALGLVTPQFLSKFRRHAVIGSYRRRGDHHAGRPVRHVGRADGAALPAVRAEHRALVARLPEAPAQRGVAEHRGRGAGVTLRCALGALALAVVLLGGGRRAVAQSPTPNRPTVRRPSQPRPTPACATRFADSRDTLRDRGGLRERADTTAVPNFLPPDSVMQRLMTLRRLQHHAVPGRDHHLRGGDARRRAARTARSSSATRRS